MRLKRCLLLTIICIICFGCNNLKTKKIDNSTEIIMIDRLIKNRMAIFERTVSDEVLHSNIVECYKIKKLSEKAYTTILNNEFEKKAIDSFNILLNDYQDKGYIKENMTSFKDLGVIKENKENALFKLKLIELSLIDDVVDRFDQSLFHFQYIEGVVKPQRNVIKLGEQFEAEVYPSGNYNPKEYTIIINGDTVKEFNNEMNPVFKFKPTKKGVNKLNGILVVKNHFDNFPFPFSYNVYVE